MLNQPILNGVVMLNISIDASTTMIGYSIWDEDVLLEYGKLPPISPNTDWRNRIISLMEQLQEVIQGKNIVNMYIEDVPKKPNGGVSTAIKLGAVQGSLLCLCSANKINPVFIEVGRWRSDIGLFNGTRQGTQRENLKEAGIDKVNEMFDIGLKKVYTKNGVFKDSVSDDDIADSILIYASTREKYQYKKPTVQFGRSRKVVG